MSNRVGAATNCAALARALRADWARPPPARRVPAAGPAPVITVRAPIPGPHARRAYAWPLLMDQAVQHHHAPGRGPARRRVLPCPPAPGTPWGPAGADTYPPAIQCPGSLSSLTGPGPEQRVPGCPALAATDLFIRIRFVHFPSLRVRPHQPVPAPHAPLLRPHTPTTAHHPWSSPPSTRVSLTTHTDGLDSPVAREGCHPATAPAPGHAPKAREEPAHTPGPDGID